MEKLLGIDAGGWLDKGVTLAFVLVVTLVAQRVVMRVMHKALDASSLPSASIFINIVRALIWAIALLSVMQPVFNTDPAGFVTALGVVSLAISLGMQDTISNIVSGISLMMGKAVQPGDVITVGSVTGEVTDVTWRSTSVRMRGGNVEVIPNSVLSKTALTRLTPWSAGYCGVPIAVRPGEDLEAVAADAVSTANEVLADLLDPAIDTDVVFTAFSAYGTQGEIRVHVREGVVFSVAQTRLVKALSGRSWIASAVG